MKALVIGAGLSGLYTTILLAQEGLEVTNVSAGRGSLSISHGALEVWDSASPSRKIPHVRPDHPYGIIGQDVVKQSIQEFVRMLHRLNSPYMGKLSASMPLLTCSGNVKRITYAPISLAKGSLLEPQEFILADLRPFRDFTPCLIQSRAAIFVKRRFEAIGLPLIGAAGHPNLNAIDLARRFEDPIWRDETLRAWKPILSGVGRIGLPAVLGLDHHHDVLDEAQDRLECDIFEIPTIPPSLRHHAAGLGAIFVEGIKAVGIIDGKVRKPAARGVMLMSKGHTRSIASDLVILATGGILNGGLVARQNGRLHESVFDLPVRSDPSRGSWSHPIPWHEQPYARFGLAVNADMQPLGVDGKPAFRNVFAAGGIVSGADRAFEGSRQGIDIATSARAVRAAMSSIQSLL
jgi:glycerol-3-phosphate dehydrogenase subunit B